MKHLAGPALLALALMAQPAQARTLAVGPGQDFPAPSAAARVAEDGDTVLIEPGEYYDCAVWRQDNLVIAGAGPGVVITDTTCQGKALFVVAGTNTTIRNLTLARARVPDKNGAGIRLERGNLTLRQVQFVNNQVGLLAGAGEGSVQILDCSFLDGGLGGDRPSFAVNMGAGLLLRIEDSTFDRVRGGQISSAAARTELFRNRIRTGVGGAPAVGVLVSGSDLVMVDNALAVGPEMPKQAAAVLMTGNGTAALRRNRLQNETGQALSLLLNWTGNTPSMQDNLAGPGDSLVSSSGVWRHRVAASYYGTKDALRSLAGRTKRGLVALVREFRQ